MMNGETVSCIVPAYNAERFLLPALESIFAQTHEPLEVIVVDDGSTDGTAAAARSLGNRVRVIHVQHGGPLAARDAGIAVAQGDFIAFLDADDLWLPEKTERQLGVMRCRPEIDLCVAYFRNFWDPEVVDEAPQYRDDSFSRPMSGYIVPTLLARRDVFDRFGGFGSDGNPSETAWFARAVAAGARLETLDDVVLQRRIHRANDSRLKPTSLDGLFQLIQMKNRGA